MKAYTLPFFAAIFIFNQSIKYYEARKHAWYCTKKAICNIRADTKTKKLA
jgi:hypothetical protein